MKFFFNLNRLIVVILLTAYGMPTIIDGFELQGSQYFPYVTILVMIILLFEVMFEFKHLKETMNN